ncbi:MAG: dienelactone hydrolase family protein [Thermomicrobiales bacterium]|nr:dienelactone hydrolase family protein [Thermomicrobiales bacterium]
MGQTTTITPDGQPAYLAVPAIGSGPGVLMLHAWWGLNDDVTGFCDRLAAEGFVVLAPSLYPGGKTAGTIPEAEALIEEHDSDAGVATGFLLAGLDTLLERPEVSSDQIGVIGFSMGAYWALWLSEKRPEQIAATVAVYGSSDGDFTSASSDYLLHHAERDDYEPPQVQQAIEQTIRDAGRQVTSYVYPDTGHWFAEPSRSDAYNAEAAELLWERTVEFLRDLVN